MLRLSENILVRLLYLMNNFEQIVFQTAKKSNSFPEPSGSLDRRLSLVSIVFCGEHL